MTTDNDQDARYRADLEALHKRFGPSFVRVIESAVGVYFQHETAQRIQGLNHHLAACVVCMSVHELLRNYR